MNLWQRINSSVQNLRSQPRKLFLVGTLVVLLIAVPISLTLVQSEQDIRQEAAKKGKNAPQNPINRLLGKNDKNDKQKKRQNNRKKKKERRKDKRKKDRNNNTPGGSGTVPPTNVTPPPTSVIPSPGPIGGEVEATINLDLFLHGIGKGGDQANPNGQGNPDPLTTVRNVYVELYDVNNQLAAELEGEVTYTSATGSYKGSVVTILPAGEYTALIDTDNYLMQAIPGIISIR